MAARPRLVLISPDAHVPGDVARLSALLPGLAGSTDFIVLRWAGSTARERFAASRLLAAVASRPRLLLRDRFDLARAAGLEGVQLPEDGMLPASVRGCWPEALIGVSRHDTSGLAERTEGADFALLSPVFESPSKPGHPGMGVEALQACARDCRVDLIAMGGIDVARAGLVLQAGATGVGVRSSVFDRSDPVAAAAALRAALDSSAAWSPDH